ncbi:MAG: glycosyltransferase [Alphaproteobacteria bacterium]|nr:glycosyltransferase [Alphaproteobacteria bacterium]
MANWAQDAAANRGDLRVVSDRRDLSVVIPAFNEEGAVRETVARVRETLDALGVSFEIIVVNDGSTDRTLAEAQASGAEVIDQGANLGYGAALKAGILAGASEYVAILDADGTYPAESLPRMMEMARHGDMVVGDRGAAMSNVPLVRRPAKWVLNSLANFLADRKIPDLNSGLRVFRRSALTPFLRLLPDGFSFTTTITLCMICSGLRVQYLPIQYGQRVGQSKIRPKHFFMFILLVLRIVMLFQPLRIFLPLGAVLFALGSAKLIYDLTLMNVSETAIFGLLAALIIWSLGLIADMMSRLHLRP